MEKRIEKLEKLVELLKEETKRLRQYNDLQDQEIEMLQNAVFFPPKDEK